MSQTRGEINLFHCTGLRDSDLYFHYVAESDPRLRSHNMKLLSVVELFPHVVIVTLCLPGCL